MKSNERFQNRLNIIEGARVAGINELTKDIIANINVNLLDEKTKIDLLGHNLFDLPTHMQMPIIQVRKGHVVLAQDLYPALLKNKPAYWDLANLENMERATEPDAISLYELSMAELLDITYFLETHYSTE